MTVNIRRFGVGMVITMSSIAFIWTNCYLNIKKIHENSNERLEIMDVPLTEIIHHLKNVPIYYYALLAMGLFWIVVSFLLKAKETTYEGTYIYISNRDTAEYKYGWIFPWLFPGLLFPLYFIVGVGDESWKMSDAWSLISLLAVGYCVSIAITFRALRNYTISETGIIIHYPFFISITYLWKDFDEMTFDHENQGSEYNLIIWNSRREYFDKYSPQNVIILYPGEELRYILHFAPTELKKDLFPLPEKMMEINKKKRKKDINTARLMTVLYVIMIFLITGVIVFAF